MESAHSAGNGGPKILVFSTNIISDPGIDFAGSSHMHYPTSVMVIPVPCSSSIKPGWVLHALEQGFDGVFIAADGTDCAYITDCGERTAKVVGDSHSLLKEHGYDAKRLKMAGICSVCAESFVAQMERFHKMLSDLPSS